MPGLRCRAGNRGSETGVADRAGVGRGRVRWPSRPGEPEGLPPCPTPDPVAGAGPTTNDMETHMKTLEN